MKIACSFSDTHPYGCDPGSCVHCRRLVEADHNPAVCFTCFEEDYNRKYGELPEDEALRFLEAPMADYAAWWAWALAVEDWKPSDQRLVAA